MERETKSISKSVRMTPTVFEIVNEFEGNEFNEKFENLVLFCFREEAKIEKSIKEQRNLYDRLTARGVKKLENIDKLINSRKETLENLKYVTKLLVIICLTYLLLFS